MIDALDRLSAQLNAVDTTKKLTAKELKANVDETVTVETAEAALNDFCAVCKEVRRSIDECDGLDFYERGEPIYTWMVDHPSYIFDAVRIVMNGLYTDKIVVSAEENVFFNDATDMQYLYLQTAAVPMRQAANMGNADAAVEDAALIATANQLYKELQVYSSEVPHAWAKELFGGAGWTTQLAAVTALHFMEVDLSTVAAPEKESDAEEESTAEPAVEEAKSEVPELPEEIQTRLDATLNILHDYYNALLDAPFEGILATDGVQVSAFKLDTNGSLVCLDMYKSNSLQNLSQQYSICDASCYPLKAALSCNYETLIRTWYEKKGAIKYMPQIHLAVLSGLLPDGRQTLKYKEHKPYVVANITTMYKTLFSLVSSLNINVQLEWFTKLQAFILNMIVVQRYTAGMLLTFASTYKTEFLLDSFKTSKELFGMDAQSLSGDGQTILVKGSERSAPDLVVTNLCFNKIAYNADINFAFKAVNEMALRGKTSDFSSVLLGTTDDNSRVTLDMSTQNVFCIPIFAGSGSGKGVMTLATLGTAIATGHPFIYLDNKPDMAALLWGIEAELNAHGMNARFLVVDSAILTGSEPKAIAKVIPERLLRNLDEDFNTAGDKTKQKRSQRGKGAFLKLLSDYEATISDITCFAICSLVGKVTQLALLLDSSDYSGKRLLAIFDECNSISAHFANIHKVSKGAFEPVLSACRAVINDKKAEASAISQAKHTVRLIGNILATVNLSAPQGKGSYAIPSEPGAVTDGVESYLNTSGRQNNALLTVCIGQDTDKLSKLFPWTVSIKHPNSSTIFGTGNVPRSSWGKFGVSETGALPTGAFVINNTVRCKSYLTLNENDYFRNDHAYYSDKLEAHKFTGGIAKGRSDQWIKANFGTEEAPEDAVGFWGYVQLLAKTNGLNLDTIVQTMNEGYDRAVAVLTKAGVMQHGGYTCVEEWLYDLNPESYFSLAQLKLGVDSMDAQAATAFEDSFDESLDGAFDAAFENKPIMPEGQAAQDDAQDGAQNNPFAGGSQGDAQNNPPAGNNTNPPPAGNNTNPPAGNNANTDAQGAWTSTPEGGYRRATPEEMQKMQDMQQATAGMNGNTAENSDESTKGYSAYGNSNAEPISFGKEGNSPFAVYQKEGSAINNALLRDEVTKQLVKAMSQNFGGLGAIYSFAVDNGMLVINGKKYAPKLPEDEIKLAPNGMQGDLAAGKYAVIFHFGYLRKMPNLISISIDDKCLAKFAFWRDLGVVEGNLKKLNKRLPHLEELKIGGVDYFGELSAEEERTLTKEQKKQLKEERSEKAIKGEALRNAGSNVAGFLANIMGFPTSTADEHPIAHAFGQSRFARAVRHGALGAGSIWLGSMLIGLASPWVLLGGIIGAGSFIMQSRNRDDRDNHYSGGRPDKDITPRRTKNKYNGRKRNQSNRDDYSAFHN